MKESTYFGKNVLVVGYGVSGRAASEFLIHRGAKVIAVDKNYSHIRDNHSQIALKHESEIQDLSSFDFIVISPGIPQNHPIYQIARREKRTVLGEIELGCRSVSNPIIGITGTNGKTTVTLLIEHVLIQSGIKAKALGNVGTPLTKEIGCTGSEEVLVLELSSYQLETLTQQVLDIGVILNVTPDHLDRYSSLQDYANAKFSMINNLKPEKYLYVEDKTNTLFGKDFDQTKIRTYGYDSSCYLYTDLNHVFIDNIQIFELPYELKGKPSHDIENLLAAYLLCREKGVNPHQFLQAIKSFKKPPHRIEFVIENSGVKYYDDSKGTNIDAVIRAVEFIPGTIILIAGGIDKGSSYQPWLKYFRNKVKYICAIGQSASKIQSELSTEIPVEIFPSLDLAVQKASELACKGDNVLLSPGCSSFDMFKDYAHRGEEFQRIVKQLKS